MAATGHDSLMQRYVPIVAGFLLIALFARLGAWQLDRARQKIALAEAFDNPASVLPVGDGLVPEAFQSIEASGTYLADRQILIDNVVKNGRLGYYVITALEWSPEAPLLLVNRGWSASDPARQSLPDISVSGEPRTIVGKTGQLPRVGIRPGEAFADKLSWPRVGVWPTAAEVAAELGRDVLPYVLLLDPQQDDGLVRQWKPRDTGTSTHYGYAFQWFAMAAAVAALMIWHTRRGRKSHER